MLMQHINANMQSLHCSTTAKPQHQWQTVSANVTELQLLAGGFAVSHVFAPLTFPVLNIQQLHNDGRHTRLCGGAHVE